MSNPNLGRQFKFHEHIDPTQVDPSARYLYAKDSRNRKVGELIWRTKSNYDKPGVIWSVGVNPEHQGQGIGSELYRRAKKLDPTVHIDPTKPATRAGIKWRARQGVVTLRKATDRFNE